MLESHRREDDDKGAQAVRKATVNTSKVPPSLAELLSVVTQNHHQPDNVPAPRRLSIFVFLVSALTGLFCCCSK